MGKIINADLVERLIAAMQHRAAAALAGTEGSDHDVELPAPEMATALLNLLASVLEPAPACRTPMGMRKGAETTGRKLLVLMRGCREL